MTADPKRAAAILSALPDVVLSVDRSGECTVSHAPEAAPSSGAPSLDELVTATSAAVFPAAVGRALDHDEHVTTRVSLARGGRTFEFEARVAPCDEHSAVVVLRDVTEVHRLRAHAAFQERMAGLGVIAAGVAHEINNSLTFVFASLDSLKGLIAPTTLMRGEAPKLLGDAREGAVRIAGIARDLRGFSRPEAADGAVDLKAVVASCARMLRAELKPRATLVIDDADAVPPVNGSEARITQVVFNLLLNAAQALDRGSPARDEVRISLKAAGDSVSLEISDTGPGIPAASRQRVFEPFYTTKPAGVGMGLFVTRGIVEELGGSITVVDADRGTRFLVTLPISKAPPRVKRQTTPRGLSRGRVLLIDDEELILSSLARLLKPLQSVQLASAEAALALFETDREFDLVLCDVMMPNTTGLELYRAVDARWPELAARFVFMSGGVYTEQARSFLDGVENLLLEKPITREALFAVLSKIGS